MTPLARNWVFGTRLHGFQHARCDPYYASYVFIPARADAAAVLARDARRGAHHPA